MSAQNEKLCPRCGEQVTQERADCPGCRYLFPLPVRAPALLEPASVKRPWWLFGRKEARQ